MARNAVVSGASTGIGRAIALHLDTLGFRVFAGVRRDEDGAALQTEASERLVPLRLDVTDEAGVATAARTVAAAVGAEGIQGLVNNAGVGGGGIAEFIDLERLRQLFEVNVFGVATMTREFLPLVRQGGGRVVHIGSNGGYTASPFIAPYSATKHAIEALADGLRRELRPWDIQVALIEPGAVATPIWEKGRGEMARLLASLPDRGRELYGPLIATFSAYLDGSEARGVPPERVAEAVAHALTAARPRTRYRVGPDAHITWWLAKFLPDRVMDAFLAWKLGLPRRIES
jgi:NAD(P)-dependent dehydrogenase (short-subunit alcohol dehydrogenase family)